jgi:hypothetical protein
LNLTEEELTVFSGSAFNCDNTKATLAEPPKFASQMRTALSSIASNTGSSSPGDELMMRRTSLTQLIEQPRILDADDGLSGEGLH